MSGATFIDTKSCFL